MLISGFAIFGLFNLKDFITREMIVFLANYYGNENRSMFIIYMMLLIFALVVQIFIINLLIHVIVRGLWIGAIGLRYVSGDIDYNKLKYNSKFINYYKRKVGSFDNYIIGLEKIASVIFSFTFLLFFVFISLFLFLTVSVFVTFILDKTGLNDYKYFNIPFIIIWVLSFALVAFDFLTLGLIKRIKQRHFASVYLVIYRIIGIITLSFLWRPLLLNFLDLKFTKRVLIGIIPYIFILTFIASGSINQFKYFVPIQEKVISEKYELLNNVIDENSFNSKYYDALRGKNNDDINFIQYISLPSNKVKGPLFEVFVKYTYGTDLYIIKQDSTLAKFKEVGYENLLFSSNKFSLFTKKEKKEIVNTALKQAGEINKKQRRAIKDSIYQDFKVQEQKAYSQNLIYIKKIIREEMDFYIDDKLIDKSKVSIDFYIHPNVKEKGMLCFFPLDSLNIGKHKFTYQKKYVINKNKDKIGSFDIKIPFIYLGK